MRPIIIFALLLSSCAPRKVVSPRFFSSIPATKFGNFAQPTPQGDTLFLVKAQPESLEIKKIWDRTDLKKKPHIRFVSADEMGDIKRRLNYGEKN